ncbi:MAG: L-aspartate oxidase [Frankiaceae bacterium]|nr:L-aspartate oxidase [Frankiaceae bacterium]
MTSDVRLPLRLRAPAPGWSVSADVVVVGSGVAGLSAALHLRAAGRDVVLVTKTVLDAGSTRWAQGGVAAALGADDDPEQHLVDTLVAGVGVCDEAAVRALVTEGPQRVRDLAALGAAFDRQADGSFALTREGGHHRNRVAHAGGDATGLEMSRALLAAVETDGAVGLDTVLGAPAGRIEVIEHALVLDLLWTAPPGAPGRRAAGVTLHVLGEGSRDGVGAVRAGAVVLASGGLGQVFDSTTNPDVSTGDGVALALRAGAGVTDLEFVQFHPTALWLGAGSRGQQPLVSEAVRGEGAFLVDADGHRVMTPEVHPMADLAPRDVVAKQMSRVMRAQRVDHLYLDARALGGDVLEARFPTIVAVCRSHGIDPLVDLVPVAPAAHYASGGVRTDLAGRVPDVPGLYACGEVACTGVHGANRLASNSLLEGLVFAARIAEDLAATAADPPEEVLVDEVRDGLLDAATRPEVAVAMSTGAGVLRTADGLARATDVVAGLASRATGGLGSAEPGPEAWQATNLHTVATCLLAAATAREETRGAHWREDFPDARDAWCGHLTTHLRADGTLQTAYEPMAVPAIH